MVLVILAIAFSVYHRYKKSGAQDAPPLSVGVVKCG
jgi:hypothetical protein